MKLVTIGTIIIIIIFFGLTLNNRSFESLNKSQNKVQIGNTTFFVEIADTDEKRTLGLSNHSPLAPNEGMLFIFSTKQFHTFWMKDMLFPIDIIWIDGDTIIDISENVPPPLSSQSALPTYQPKFAVDKVLEVAAGTVQENSIRISDKIRIP